MKKTPLLLTIGAALLLFCPLPTQAGNAIDSGAGYDLPLASGGTVSLTLCATSHTENSVCATGYEGKVVFGAPNAPTAWIDPTSGQSSYGTPTGAVMAFDLDACPAGWTALASASGRTIVGVGTASVNSDGTTVTGATSHTRGQKQGEETHALTTDEMPKHQHLVPTIAVNAYGIDTGGPKNHVVTGGGTDTVAPYSSAVGSNTAHNIMQPYLALLYCRKN